MSGPSPHLTVTDKDVECSEACRGTCCDAATLSLKVMTFVEPEFELEENRISKSDAWQRNAFEKVADNVSTDTKATSGK